MKKSFDLIHFPAKLYILFLIVLSIITGFSLFIVKLSNMVSYLNEEPETCINCHVMNSLYTSWNHSSHRERAHCVDCHIPHNNIINKYYAKSRDGMKDVYKYTFRLERNVPRATDESRNILQENCLHCHKKMIKSVNPVMADKMEDTEWNGKQCWHCHRLLPHNRVRGLTTAPNAEMQKIRQPVPDWLDKKLVMNSKQIKK